MSLDNPIVFMAAFCGSVAVAAGVAYLATREEALRLAAIGAAALFIVWAIASVALLVL